MSKRETENYYEWEIWSVIYNKMQSEKKIKKKKNCFKPLVKQSEITFLWTKNEKVVDNRVVGVYSIELSGQATQRHSRHGQAGHISS